MKYLYRQFEHLKHLSLQSKRLRGREVIVQAFFGQLLKLGVSSQIKILEFKHMIKVINTGNGSQRKEDCIYR